MNVTVPASVAPGSRYRVRVDGVDTGKISHFGLSYIFDMESQWPIPPGTEYVDGSAHIVPGTGSANVRPGARVVVREREASTWFSRRTSTTASAIRRRRFEFDLAVVSAEGAAITQRFAGYSVSVHAAIVGDLRTTCEPTPKAFPVAVTRVESSR